MLALVEITPWHWAGFILAVLFLLALDLGVFHRRPGIVKFKEAIAWTLFWVILSLSFAAILIPWSGHATAVQFLTGYFIELSLSMDNVFVIALIFLYCRVPEEYQHRLLFWGILGALVMRGLMIVLGVALINRFAWLLYVLGAFLILTGIKMILARAGDAHPENNILMRAARRWLPVSAKFDGQKFLTRSAGRLVLTPLFLALIMVEISDLIFAVDSIPAIFGVTRNAFIVFTSNIFAILGLRSLYFVLAGAIQLFRYLKVGLAVVLVFIGAKMVLDPHDQPPRWFQLQIPDLSSLAVVVGIIALAILASLIASRREQAARAGENPRP